MEQISRKRIVSFSLILMLAVSALIFSLPMVASESNVSNAKQQYDAFRYTKGVTQYPYTMQYYDKIASATTPSDGPKTNHTLWTAPLNKVLGTAVAYGRIWVSYSGPTTNIMSLDAYTGETIWQMASSSTLGSTSAPYLELSNDKGNMGLIYAIFNGALGCYRASDGAKYWELPLSKFQSYIANTSFPTMAPGFGPVGPTSDKYIFVADGDGNIATGAPGGYHVWAITKGTSGGKITWATPVTNETNYWSGGPATLANGILYVGEYAGNFPINGHQNAFNATTGQLLWSTVIGGVSTYGITVQDNVVYTNISPGFDVPGGAIIALDATTGATLWRFNTTGIPMSNPIIYKNTLYQAAYLDDKLYALDKNTGTLQWSMNSPGGGRGITLANGVIYGTAYGSILKNGTYDNGFFYALDPNTNTLLWKYYLSNEQFKTNNGAYSRGFAVADGIAYGGDLTGTLFAFGKGPTTTETSVTDSNINQGTAIAIYGKVYDESPASPGAPVANSQVKLQAQKTGETSWSDVGTATTDATGRFVGQWTPPSEGTYRVMAKFDGNGDYGWSSSSTIVQVNAAQAPAQTNATSTTELALIAGIIVVAVLVIAVLALQLRKPKKQT